MTIVNGRLGVIRSGAEGENWYAESQALFRLLDALIMGAVLDKDLATPPGSPADGAMYIVAASPTGAWVGHAKSIAYWDATAAAWFFYAPLEGFSVRVADEDKRYTYDGSTWAVEVGTAAALDSDTDITLAAASNAKIATQAAVKSYVDAKVAGLSWKQAVRFATTVAGTLASSFENGDTVDGGTLSTGDRILLKNQAAGAENGIYTVNASGAPTRATDADAGAELVNATVYVSEGTVNADTQWTCTTNATITLGSTSLAFAQLTSGGATTLDSLTDVNAPAPANGDVLTWDSTPGEWVPAAPTGGGGAGGAEVCCGRLTLQTGVPIPVTDQTGKTTIYLTPYKGNRIALYNGSTWDVLTFSETSLALGTLTSGKNYDVFAYNNSGTLALELLAWTNDTTRATALVLQDGVLSKTGALTRRYLGTFRTTSTTTTEDSAAKRFTYNYYHQRARELIVIESADSWSYNTGTWRQTNANAANQVEYVCGVAEGIVHVTVLSNTRTLSVSTRAPCIAVGLDSTTTPSGQVRGSGYEISGTASLIPTTAHYRGPVQLGYHYLAWLEFGGDGTETWFGDNGSSTSMQSGLTGTIEC